MIKIHKKKVEEINFKNKLENKEMQFIFIKEDQKTLHTKIYLNKMATKKIFKLIRTPVIVC